MTKFYNKYENNNLYKIPKLFKLSENILIMEYVCELLKIWNYQIYIQNII